MSDLQRSVAAQSAVGDVGAPDQPLARQVLDRWYGGERDPETLARV